MLGKFFGLMGLSVICMFCFASPMYSEGGSDAPVGVIVSVKGRVTITDVSGKPRSARLKGALFEGDRVETGRRGFLSMEFTDGGNMQMAGNSALSIDEYAYSAGSGDGHIKISTENGLFSALSGEIAKTNPKGWQLNAATATIGVRGTHLNWNSTDVERSQLYPFGLKGATTVQALPHQLPDGSFKESILVIRSAFSAGEEVVLSSNDADNAVTVSEEGSVEFRLREGMMDARMREARFEEFMESHGEGGEEPAESGGDDSSGGGHGSGSESYNRGF